MILTYNEMLDRILDSDFAKEWIKDRESDLQDEIDFYGHKLSEKQWKENLVCNFFEQGWLEIRKVLPELWDEIKGIVDDELSCTVFEKAEDFVEYIDSKGWGSHVNIPFDLYKYLESLEKTILQALDKRFESSETEVPEKQTKSTRIKSEVLESSYFPNLVSRRYVAKKGCFNAFLTPTAVCVNLGEVQNRKTGKKEFYCIRNFPIDCSKFGCPKMMPVDPSWLKDLVKIKNYRVEGIAGE